MSADALITRDGQVPTPLDYVVPVASAMRPIVVTASFDGSGAATGFVPCLEIIAPTGDVVARCPIADTIAAAGSADVSWFPGGVLSAAAASFLPVSETLLLDTTVGLATSTIVLQTGVSYLVSAQGTVSDWNLVLDHGTPEPDAMFPTLGPRVSTEVGIDPDTLFAYPTAHPQTPGNWQQLEFDAGSGFAYLAPFGGPYTTPQPGHFYSYSITGQGQVLKVKWNDSPLTDNYGYLKIVIYSVPAPPPGGGVASVTAADTSIVIGGSAANPTVRTGSLDVIAADHPPAADWSNNNHKITSVLDPTAAQDAATKNYVDTHGGGGAVTSVFTRTGAVVANTGDYTAAQVTNAADKSSGSQQAFTGEVQSPDFKASGLTGAVQASRYVGATASGAPASGTFAVGDFVIAQNGHLFVCTVAGSPGTWVDVATAGSPLTTKGDLFGHSTVDARIPVGADGTALLADSTQTLGVKWGSPSVTTSAVMGRSVPPAGALVETIPRFEATGGTAPTSGQVQLVAINLDAGVVITSISFANGSTAIASATHQVFGLYDSSLNLLRSTVDDTSTAWAANTIKTLALTSTFTTTYAGLHWIALLLVATTRPNVLNSGTGAIPGALRTPPYPTAIADSGQTALPNPATIGSSQGFQYYAFLS